MIAYLGRRLVQSVLILLGVSIITFALLYLLLDPIARSTYWIRLVAALVFLVGIAVVATASPALRAATANSWDVLKND